MSAKIVALFPGQGSQHVGMCKDLLTNFALAKQVFEEASEAIKLDLRRLCLDGPESDLTLTTNTQPALLTASVAAFRVAQAETGFSPSAVAGHSLGEYSALVAIGCLPLSSAARWVRERGAAMQIAVPAGQGTMAAILSLDDEAVVRICENATENAKTKRSNGEAPEMTVPALVQPANFNAPGQVVIAGSTDAVGEAVALAKSGEYGKAKAMPLSVSAPFHCSLMKPARERMAQLFADATAAEKPKNLTSGYFPNRTARLTQESSVVFELLIEQVDHPVLWKQSVLAMLSQGYRQAIEFGPGKVLQGLAKRIPDSTDQTLTVITCGEPGAISTVAEMLKGN